MSIRGVWQISQLYGSLLYYFFSPPLGSYLYGTHFIPLYLIITSNKTKLDSRVLNNKNVHIRLRKLFCQLMIFILVFIDGSKCFQKPSRIQASITVITIINSLLNFKKANVRVRDSLVINCHLSPKTHHYNQAQAKFQPVGLY